MRMFDFKPVQHDGAWRVRCPDGSWLGNALWQSKPYAFTTEEEAQKECDAIKKMVKEQQIKPDYEATIPAN